MANGGVSIQIKQIEPGDRLTGLSLGDAAFKALKTFIRRDAQKYEEQNLARTYAAFRSDNDKLVGYITLVCGQIDTSEECEPLVEAPGLEFNYDHYPAVKIARLAVDQRISGSGLGRFLVNLALGQAKEVVCPAIGCRFVVVDAKQKSVGFYAKCGFTLLDTEANRARANPVMWIDLYKVASASLNSN